MGSVGERCVICFEDKEEGEIRRLCDVCRESGICGDCRKMIIGRGHLEMLTSCPLCRAPTRYSFDPSFQPGYHVLTLLGWYAFGLVKTLWKSSAVIFLSHFATKWVIQRSNPGEDYHPLMVEKRWAVFNLSLHVPYWALGLYLRYRGYEQTEDDVLDTYILYQLVTPLAVGSLVWVYRKLRRTT